jgi:hypothetical protein
MGSHAQRRQQRLWTGVAVAHSLLALVWFLASLGWQNRAVWFMAGALVPAYLATAAALLLATAVLPLAGSDGPEAAGAHALIMPFVAFIGVLDTVALIPIGLYIYNMFSAHATPDGAVDDPTTRDLAHRIWETEPALAIFTLVMLGLTALAALAGVVAALLTARRPRPPLSPAATVALRTPLLDVYAGL